LEFKELAKYGEVFTAEEIKKRWPAMNVPSYLKGVYAKEAGVVKVKTALNETKRFSIEHGADLRFNQNVVHIDHDKSIVTLESGQQF